MSDTESLWIPVERLRHWVDHSGDFTLPSGATAFQGTNRVGLTHSSGNLAIHAPASCTTTTAPLNYFSYLGGLVPMSA